MNPRDIIHEFYPPGSKACEILLRHGEQVAQKSIEIAALTSHPDLDLVFLEQAAMLHDIGIFMTEAPGLGCFGSRPYLCHGFLGRELLDKLGFPAHGLVAERHTGAGITEVNIRENGLPLPRRDMIPLTTEEIIICVADKFFSKSPGNNIREKSMETIINGLESIDPSHAARFSAWVNELIPLAVKG
ncbi:conserved hypothetical protein [Desulforapulum autotrophicum HRM2]|jgi:uncharacterized protein|uniref:HD domain-containing protein n=1 Tax=Desulforapulum autotrophicum (strain ATCC 43914 / DSM 3382 / VKM B-1955 / HRM2) TaxID=177437 RepID=C0QHH5_DESAH|nr:HD domain-containing protein [Desulforapulum autotrophicum]ACN17834.1 conserved hypothetical protein [Desulforapulum autotrophicum HRM2]